MIALREVRFRYPHALVLDGVDCTVRPGEAVGLFGANGAGKSTILRLCMALLQPASGSVTVAGQGTKGRAPEDLAGDVGFLFQRPEDQLIRTTVRDEIAYGPERLGWSAAKVRAAVDASLRECGLEEQAAWHPYDLSLPRRRLVALASILVGAPKVLLLDEPTALLDRGGRALVADIIRSRVAAGVAVLAVVHDPVFAVEALDRGVVLAGGRIVADEAIGELLRSGKGGLPLPPAVVAAEAAGVRSESLRLADLAGALGRRLGG
jgi:energy-coupling factor transport system ATP-binding protein